MKRLQLVKLGIPDDQEAINAALTGIQEAGRVKVIRDLDLKSLLPAIIAAPHEHIDHPQFAALAKILVERQHEPPPRAPVRYQTWGTDIDDAAHAQMRQACALPNAFAAALMPDAHLGYGLPIGGVLALEEAVCPYAVGVDIACRMKLSVFDMPVGELADDRKFPLFRDALENGTLFGVGGEYKRRLDHDVMDLDWTVSRVTRENKDKAWRQLGTSGSGNHFAEFGMLTLTADDAELNLPAGEYVALLTHSGSRGTGASVCSTYSAIAQARLPRRYREFGRLAWLEMSTQEGQEYWAAMNLMGEYAAANHACIHRNVARLLGAETRAGVENHHNFAWQETHHGKQVYVHRKGATPAGPGVLGVIPGSMADPGFVVRGKGNGASLNSASHGAGRCMSRTKALAQFNYRATKNDLEKKGVKILSAGADELPQVYKNIHAVMAAQSDLIEIVARFDPKIVKMCGDGSKAED